MAKRALPLVDKPPSPTADAARKRLGGRATSGAGVGRVVRLGDAVTLGVVVFVAEGECDVLFETGVVRRARPEAVAAHTGEVPRSIQRLADDARVFGGLREGQRVRFETEPGNIGEGTLREKCRYGALVVREEGKALAIGFRKLWPMATGDAS